MMELKTARKFVCVCLLTVSILAAVSVRIFAATNEGAAFELKTEASDFMRKNAYDTLNINAPNISKAGAYGKVNQEFEKTKQGKWWIEEQRYGRDLVIAGIARKDTKKIENGLLVFKWGFSQQKDDGSWDCPDAFHSTSFFVEAAADALILLEASEYKDKYKTRINEMKPSLLKAARWMTLPDIEAAGKKYNQQYTHRRYAVADALGLTGVLCDDKDLIAKSTEYVKDGISLQDASGFNPEKKGYDSSYHAVGVVYMERYLTMVAPSIDAKLKQQLYDATEKAANWEISRLNDDGSMNLTGNTRVVAVKEAEANRDGTLKKPAYFSTYRGIYFWSRIADKKDLAKLAEKVAKASRK